MPCGCTFQFRSTRRLELLAAPNNSFKPTPFRCVACVRSLRSHASPHRSRRGLTQALALRNSWSCSRSSVTSGSRVGPRELSRLRLTSGFGDQSACFRRSRNEERSDLRLGCHELRPREKRKDRRANNSFKPTPLRCVACVRSLRSHASPHRSRRGLTQALCGGHKRASLVLAKHRSTSSRTSTPL